MSEPGSTSDGSRWHSTSRYQTADEENSGCEMYEVQGKRTQDD